MSGHRKKRIITGIVILLGMLLPAACGRQDQTDEKQNDTGFVAADTGVSYTVMAHTESMGDVLLFPHQLI